MENNKQTAVDWLIEQLGGNGHISTYESIKRDELQSIIEQAKEMEKKQIIDANIAGMEFIPVDSNRYQEDAEQYYSETFGTKEQMTREEKLETIVKLFAKSMFYGYWEWETPNERVITMLMQEVDMFPFKDEDDMISKTSVSEDLYKKAIKEVIPRQAKGWDESKTDKANEK